MRLIDADALSEKLCKITTFIKGGEMFQRMINDAPTIEPDGDTISRRAAILAITGEPPEAHYPSWYAERIKSLPSATSAEVEDRLYIKIYADDEPSVKAEKLYQICGETQNREVAEWLKEYFPSAPDSRQRGEWVRLEREENVYDLHGVPTWGVNYMCDKCGFITTAIQDHFAQYKWCPSCGADMREGDNNGNGI